MGIYAVALTHKVTFGTGCVHHCGVRAGGPLLACFSLVSGDLWASLFSLTCLNFRGATCDSAFSLNTFVRYRVRLCTTN